MGSLFVATTIALLAPECRDAEAAWQAGHPVVVEGMVTAVTSAPPLDFAHRVEVMVLRRLRGEAPATLVFVTREAGFDANDLGAHVLLHLLREGEGFALPPCSAFDAGAPALARHLARLRKDARPVATNLKARRARRQADHARKAELEARQKADAAAFDAALSVGEVETAASLLHDLEQRAHRHRETPWKRPELRARLLARTRLAARSARLEADPRRARTLWTWALMYDEANAEARAGLDGMRAEAKTLLSHATRYTPGDPEIARVLLEEVLALTCADDDLNHEANRRLSTLPARGP